MSINDFFEPINDKKTKMEKALKKYVEATEDFYTITGVKYTDMPKSKGKVLGFDDLMANIEELFNDYLELRNQHKILYDFYISYINKLNNKTYRLIIEYSYINNEDDKQITNSLKEYHKLDYTNSHIRKLKSKASKEFNKLINDKVIEELEKIKIQFDTK